MGNELFIVSQGSPLTINALLKDADGVTITTYTGSETLLTTVWSGTTQSAVFTEPAAWVLPSAGTIRVTVTGIETALCVPGDYQLTTRLDDSIETVDAYTCRLRVTPFAGGLTTPASSGSVTRAIVEQELVERAAAMLLVCGKSVNADGANQSLMGPIWYGLSLLGLPPAVPGSVTDADLAQLPLTSYMTFCDLAELRLIENCLGSFAQPDQTQGNTKVQLNTMMVRFQRRAQELESKYAFIIQGRLDPTVVGPIQYAHPTMVGTIRFSYPTPGTIAWGLGYGRYDH